MSKLNALKKLIKEAVTEAIKEELPRLLAESQRKGVDYKSSLREGYAKKVGQPPLTLNEPPVKKKVDQMFKGNNPLADLLNETAMSMSTDDEYSFGVPTEDGHTVNSFDVFQPKEVGVGSINEMLSTAIGASSVETVQINTVPDYSGIMNKMKEKGMI